MTTSSARLDDIDRLLVNELVANARTKLSDLATKVLLSTSAVHARVHRLESLGVIEGYHAAVDHGALGCHISAFVAISPADPADHAGLAERLVKYREIESLYSLSGTADYLALVRATTTTALGDFLLEVRASLRVNTQVGVITKVH
ncbi:Lrp/AsnC family transcriptional regulator [Rhodococcus maanshanensis]|uniref:Lrp/AsnC family transcriptional regulator n=1 Tax=Rhodococcus maanshanensis TaxID=183556 RepID=UPI000A8FF2B6|nr:Lrp/AsnC family transcriptional regulator [Rhodococcus maanshanensis]